MATLVQSNRNYESTSDTSFGVAFLSNVTSGNLLVVTIGAYHNSATISAVSDTRGTSPWTQVGTLLRATTSQAPYPFLAIYYGFAGSSGANTITATFSTSVGDKEIKIFELSGVDGTTPLNATQTATGITGSGAVSVNTPSITTTVPGWILKVIQEWSWGSSFSPASGTPTTGWTEFGETAQGSDSAYRNETGTGTFTGGFAWTSGAANNGYCVRIVAFADASGGSTLRPRLWSYRQRRSS